MAFAHILLQMGGGVRTSIPSLVLHASVFSKFILLVLVVLSVWTWAVVWNRLRLYAAVERADRAFLQAFRAAGAGGRLAAEQFAGSILARVALAGQRALDPLLAAGMPQHDAFEIAQRAMDRAAADEIGALEKHVGFLATTGNTAPFIGLLGTVWGVMTSFVNIGAQGSATLVVVAPGIAEALIATIAGLAAAIPAVIAYNHCLGRLREASQRAQQFSGEYLERRAGAPRA